MSVTTSIYIQSDEDEEVFGKSLEEILQVHFRPSEDPFILFGFADPSAHIEGYLETNDDDLADLTTDAFQYRINVHSRAKSERGQIDYARQVFQKLRGSGKYPLLLLHNHDNVLDEYIPKEG